MKLPYLIYFLVLLTPFYGKAETITVTTNNDNGPGSLREAIQKANANNQQDLIVFNISGITEQDRTINLETQLPFISSSMVIDATTQPGTFFGRSSAKIIIQPKNTTVYSAFVIKDADGVELYGFYARDFTNRMPNGNFAGGFLYTENAKNIKIGAANKGNVIANCANFVLNSDYSLLDSQTPLTIGIENLSIKGNFIGFEPDGKSYRATPTGLLGGLYVCLAKGNYDIGGDDDKERNYFGNIIVFINLHYSQFRNKRYAVHLNLRNNYFSFDVDGQPTPLASTNNSNNFVVLYQTFGGDVFPTQPGSATIINNKSICNFGINMTNLNGPILFQGNQFLKHPNPVHEYNWSKSIFLTSSEAVKIGGENPGEANTLYNIPVYINSPKSAIAQRNSMYCTVEKLNADVFLADGGTIPTIKILTATNSLVTGITEPNAKVELFSDDDCSTCQPHAYLTTITADANGNWSYAGNFSKAIIASATINGYTSNFTRIIQKTYANITQATCNEANGAIVGLTVENAVEYIWTDQNNNSIGNNPDIYNLKPGKYKLTTKNLSCTRVFGEFEIVDMTPEVRDQNKIITHPTCNSLGSITYLYLTKYSSDYTYSWTNQRGEEVATRIDAYNLPEGSYTLSIKYKNNCEVKYGPVVLKNQAAPTLDESMVKIKTADCSQNNGSITSLTTTSNTSISYKWINERNVVVGTNLDLLNVPAGKYYLEMKDAGGCATVYSSLFEITELNSITINSLGLDIKNATCQSSNGSIKGIIVNGATSYKWTNSNGVVISNNLELENAPSGAYTLEVSNSYCKKTSSYNIQETPNSINISSFSMTHQDASCNLNNGFLEYNADQYTKLPKSYYWKNELNQTISQTKKANNLSAGKYTLFGIDDNNCHLLLTTYEIKNIPPLALNENKAIVRHATCQQKNGFISGLDVTGGLPPYQFEWTNSDGVPIQGTNDINHVESGSYRLKITDASNCTAYSRIFVIQGNATSIPQPITKPIFLCSPKEINVSVSSSVPNGTYTLYENEYSNKAIATSNDGNFSINITQNKSYFVSIKVGNCESERSELKVYTGFSNLSIPNTISPNNDNINDEWLINGIENYPDVKIQIFSRTGTRVFNSIGYKTPFNGNYHNTPLPVGVYYYIINFGPECKTITGNLNIIR